MFFDFDVCRTTYLIFDAALELTLSKYAAAAASALLQSHDLSGLSHSARIIARVDFIINVNLFMMGRGSSAAAAAAVAPPSTTLASSSI